MGTAFNMTVDTMLLTQTDSCNQRTDTDTGSTEVADFINLDRKSVVEGKSVDLGVRRISKKR